MDNSIFFQHHQLVLDGRLEGIYCIKDDHALPMHPFIDLETNKAYFECLQCDFRINPGTLMYNKLFAEVSAEQKNPTQPEFTDES